MTILYKVQNNFKPLNILPQRPYCRISSKNVVAFSIAQNINVCDIASPWQYFKVCTSKNIITALEWNCSGELLLVANKGGTIEIWSPKNFTLNTWELLYRTSLSNEHILHAKFFHNGKSFFFNSQKKDLSLYAEKFERLDQRPTLAQFGNVASEGFVAVTTSGLVGVVVISPNGQTIEHHQTPNNDCPELTATTHRLNLQRGSFSNCSLSHNRNGSLTLAVYGKNCPHTVLLFKLTIRYDFDRIISLKCESLPSVITNSNSSQKISLIRNCIVNNEDVLLIVYKLREGGSILEQWNLTKKAQIVHKLLQKNKGDFVQLDYWENMGNVHFLANVNEICISKMVTDFLQISVMLTDNTVQIFESGLKKLGAIAFEKIVDDRECQFFAGDVSYMNQILLVVDNLGQMYAMQLPYSHSDKNFKPNPLTLQVALLEYCIVSGVDSSDILLLNPLNLDMLVEKLTENFTRQHSYTRQYYYSSFLALKSSMCRMQSKQTDFDNLIMLHSISITFKSLLRPSDLSSQDKGPADNLAIIISESLTDVDKVLFNLDAKDFTVEPSTLQSLQQLIQWVADLALSILNRLPEEVMKSKLSKKQGYDISRDTIAIGTIRELLVMIRIWGLLNAQCLPIYTKSVENIDVLSILFRLLTRLAQNAEPDEILLDECSTLSTQVLPARENHAPITTLLLAPKSFPLLLTVGIPPPILQDIYFEEAVFTKSTKDGVSNLHLGSRIHHIRKCIRCGFVNDSQKNAKTSALKAWYNRWLYCHCGGFWKA